MEIFCIICCNHRKKFLNTQINIITGIVAGMYHLMSNCLWLLTCKHSEKLIQRDLAARNVLLTKTFEPKVSGALFLYFDLQILEWQSKELLRRIYSEKSDEDDPLKVSGSIHRLWTVSVAKSQLHKVLESHLRKFSKFCWKFGLSSGSQDFSMSSYIGDGQCSGFSIQYPVRIFSSFLH